MEQLTTFVSDNFLLFGALAVVLVLLIKAEIDHQANKGLMLAPTAAIRMLNNNEKALVIDVRSSGEFKNGHIKGAKNVPIAELDKKLDNLCPDKNNTVLVYCNSGHTSTKAMRILKSSGYEKINNLEGGILAWKDANLPLSKKK